ncbi:MAG: alpha-hydroxy-acid oxidizing protein [Burkholderiales bacterium]|nr:alpha-hydroxy-acid oxidizing protein [Burkholderiales bacterium]
MSSLDRCHNIEALRQQAARYLPRLVMDYIEGGVDDERCLLRNRSAFDDITLLPRYMVDVSSLSLSRSLWGRTYAMPLGIAPTGLAGFARHGADLMLAQAAVKGNVPFVLSGAGTASIEQMAKVAPEHAWYQLYVSREQRVTEDIVCRARDAGVQHLVVTVDVPVHSNRERDVRNGFVPPVKPTASTILNALCHPVWLARFVSQGLPRFENWAPYAPPGASAKQIADLFSSQIPFTQTWRDLARLRQIWPGRLIVKGILHEGDARQAVEAGADGVIVSNHGGRVLDGAPSPLTLLPAIRQAVGPDVRVMMDSGVRRGADVVKALALGADFVFAGRPFMYGVAAGGQAGAERALAIFQRELSLTVSQLGGWGTAAPPERSPSSR